MDRIRDPQVSSKPRVNGRGRLSRSHAGRSIRENLPSDLGDPYVVHGEYLRRKFSRFVKAAWHVIEPGTPLVWNWHLDVICDHLQAVSEGRIGCLIINIPPRCMKSSLVSVLWPAWEWISQPHLQYLTGSYDDALATRDAVNARKLMQSKWYQRRFGHLWSFAGDQNAKTRYQNDKNGHRIVVSSGSSVVGEGGHRVLIDDPHDPTKAMNSDPDRKKALDQYDNGFSTRQNDLLKAAEVIIMQRVALNDLTGHVLAKYAQAGVRVDHIVIPMEFDGVRRSTSLGEYDPRTEVGELLWDARFPAKVLVLLKIKLGEFGTASQLQQQPTARGGNIFKLEKFQWYTVAPEFEEVMVSVDCTFKDKKTSDYVAIQAWGRVRQRKYLIRRLKRRMNLAATCTELKLWRAAFPNAVAFVVEDKANGPAVIETMQGDIPGLVGYNPQGDKHARGYACQPQQEAAQVFLPDPEVCPEIIEFTTEVCGFPGAANDDEYDAMCQAILWMSLRPGQGVFEWYREQAEAASTTTERLRAKAPDTPEQFTKSSQQLWMEEQERAQRAQGLVVTVGESPWHSTKRKAA